MSFTKPISFFVASFSSANSNPTLAFHFSKHRVINTLILMEFMACNNYVFNWFWLSFRSCNSPSWWPYNPQFRRWFEQIFSIDLLCAFTPLESPTKCMHKKTECKKNMNKCNHKQSQCCSHRIQWQYRICLLCFAPFFANTFHILLWPFICWWFPFLFLFLAMNFIVRTSATVWNSLQHIDNTKGECTAHVRV